MPASPPSRPRLPAATRRCRWIGWAMLDNGADPNVALPYQTLDRGARNNSNAMVWAAEQDDPIYLKLPLDHGGDPNTRNANNETLLFHALIKQNKRADIQLLVERGADVNALAGMGGTLIDNYAIGGAFEEVHWLLKRKADPTLVFNRGVPVHRMDSGAIEAIPIRQFSDPATSPPWSTKAQREKWQPPMVCGTPAPKIFWPTTSRSRLACRPITTIAPCDWHCA